MLALSLALLLAADAGVCTPVNDPVLADSLQPVAEAAAVAQPGPCESNPRSLADALAAANTTPDGRAQIEALAQKLAAETGRTLTPDQLDAMVADPKSLEGLLTVSIPTVAAGLAQAQQVAGLKTPSPAAAPSWKLPDGVDLADAASYFDATVDGPKPIGTTGLLRGDPSAGLSDAQVRSRRALAEIFDRLSDNEGLPRAQRFHVCYRGRRYDRLGSFLAALQRNGNDVRAVVVQRVANFIDLRVPNADGSSCPILATVMIDTGYKDASGAPIAVPGVHSSLRFEISGPDADGAVDFYQGTDGTGFFAAGLNAERPYLGHQESDVFTGRDVVRAAEIGARWRQAVGSMSAGGDLIGGGYGQTGVCNDSVALIQMMLTGRTTLYPLAMNHDLVSRWLDAQIAKGGSDAGSWTRIKAGVDRLPADSGSDPTQRSRILGSLPFGPGPNALYPGVDAARATFAPPAVNAPGI